MSNNITNNSTEPHDVKKDENAVNTTSDIDTGVESSKLLYGWEDSKFFIFYGVMSCVGIYYRFIQHNESTTFIISEMGDWTIFMLSALTNLIRTNSWYLGLFGIVLTLIRRNLIKFHSYYTIFSGVVFLTILFSYCLYLL